MAAALTAALAGCGGRTDLPVLGATDGALGSGGAIVLLGSGGTRAASGGSSDGGKPVCEPRSLGSELGIPVVEGVLSGASAYSSSCGGKGPEAWFQWTAPQRGTWAFDALGSDGSATVTVLDGAGGCVAFPEIACSNAGRATVVALEQGQTVTVVVDTDARTSGYSLSISGPIRAGDTPCGAVDVGARLGSLRVGRLGEDATVSTSFACGGSTTSVVVTTWTAPTTNTFIFNTTGSSFDTLLEVRETCGSGQIYGCSDDFQGTDARIGLFFEQGARLNVLLGGKAVVHPEEARYVLSITDHELP